MYPPQLALILNPMAEHHTPEIAPPKNFVEKVILPDLSSYARDRGYEKEYAGFVLLTQRESDSVDVFSIKRFCNAFNRSSRERFSFFDGKLWTFEIGTNDPFVKVFEVAGPATELIQLYSKLDELKYTRYVFWLGVIIAAILTSGTPYFFVALGFAILPFIVPTIIKRFV